VSHFPVSDPTLFARLLQFDTDLAGESQALGCRHCGGVLHQAHYPRKPRGVPSDQREAFSLRFSFCCADCRRRVTSPSLRFLGRKVYVGLVVVLASCCEGRIASWFAKVSAATGVSLRTLYRWGSFWRDSVPATPFWREAAARFVPPPEVARFPAAALLERFGIQPPADQALLAFLQFLSPLSVGPVIRFGEG